jgi:hypothetical protein
VEVLRLSLGWLTVYGGALAQIRLVTTLLEETEEW